MGIGFFDDRKLSVKGLVLTLGVSNISEAARQLENALGFKRIYAETGQLVLHNEDLSESLYVRLLTQGDSKHLSEDHLVVFYLNDARKFQRLCEKLKEEGAEKVESFNPYWDDFGATFFIAGAFRLVLCPGNYPAYKARIAAPTNNLPQVESDLRQLLGLKRIGGFENHRGFDGVMLASHSPIDCHFEFTSCQHVRLPDSHNHSHQLGFLLEQPFPDSIRSGNYYQVDFFRADDPIANACLSKDGHQKQLGVQ